jgi:hypothetical protein
MQAYRCNGSGCRIYCGTQAAICWPLGLPTDQALERLLVLNTETFHEIAPGAPEGYDQGVRLVPHDVRCRWHKACATLGVSREGSEMAQIKQVPLVEYHPKAPDASPERLRRLAGSIPFKGEVPSTKFLGQPEEAPTTERARD